MNINRLMWLERRLLRMLDASMVVFTWEASHISLAATNATGTVVGLITTATVVGCFLLNVRPYLRK